MKCSFCAAQIQAQAVLRKREVVQMTHPSRAHRIHLQTALACYLQEPTHTTQQIQVRTSGTRRASNTQAEQSWKSSLAEPAKSANGQIISNLIKNEQNLNALKMQHIDTHWVIQLHRIHLNSYMPVPLRANMFGLYLDLSQAAPSLSLFLKVPPQVWLQLPQTSQNCLQNCLHIRSQAKGRSPRRNSA